jgi:lysophospholipase L1-like esterase
VLLGAAHEVARKGFEVDAREGRFMRNALKVLRHLKRDHRRPPVVVIAIGTNMPATRREIATALRLLTHRQTLALVTPFRSGAPLSDGAAWAAHRSHPHRVRIIDWAHVASTHGEWFYADGTHLRPSGARAYARALAIALRWIGPDYCACEGVIQPTRTLVARRRRGQRSG